MPTPEELLAKAPTLESQVKWSLAVDMTPPGTASCTASSHRDSAPGRCCRAKAGAKAGSSQDLRSWQPPSQAVQFAVHFLSALWGIRGVGRALARCLSCCPYPGPSHSLAFHVDPCFGPSGQSQNAMPSSQCLDKYVALATKLAVGLAVIFTMKMLPPRLWRMQSFARSFARCCPSASLHSFLRLAPTSCWSCSQTLH